MTGASKYRIVKFSDDCTFCEVCGKTELKGTYIMEDLTSGDIFRAGSTCGRKMAGWTAKEFTSKLKEAQEENFKSAQKEFRASDEFLAYRRAMDFLDAEAHELHLKMHQCRTEEERNAVRASERTLKSRMAYIEPFSKAYDGKRDVIAAKYNTSPWRL